MTKLNHLIDYFQPEHYDLSLNLERLARNFNGKVIITGTRTDSATPIKLHAKDLNIQKVLVNDQPSEVAYGENDEITLVPQSNPITDDLVLILEFSGKITDAMHGIYPCYYEYEDEKKELLATQFESHHAREAFPCIDEPAAKATFDLTLETENNITTLSNMPILKQAESNKRLTTQFATTPRMSTYLLAFVVGDLHNVSAKTKAGVEVNIWATPAQSAKSLSFALDVAKRSIEFFDDYFGIHYPLPKADHVALPDFSSGAMENWGLITYREACLIAEPESASISTKQLIATVIAHETSHQWFGNLVTMQWWNDLWLNESFANMMEYVAVDALFPSWKIWTEFASHESLMALRRDALPGVQPVKIEVNHPDEIATVFDPAIVYAKGGNLLNMLRSFIGETAFKEGLRDYFKKHAYKNTTGDDLWQSLAVTSKKDIGAFMKDWLEQSGYPVVTAHLDKDATLTLSQKHFLIGKKGDSRSWTIPLFSNDNSLPELLTAKPVHAEMTQEFIKLNQNDASYFITRYDQALESRLLKNITKLSDIDRLQVLNDASLLSKAGLKPASELIDLLLAYKAEATQPVWDIISLLIGDLRRFTENNDTAEVNLKALTRQIARSLYNKLGWETQPEDSEQTLKLRAGIIGLMLFGEDKDAITEAIRRYNSVEDIALLDGELRASILSACVKHSGDPHIIDTLLAYHHKTVSSDLQQDICISLTSTRDPAVISRLLSLITDGEQIRPQDVPRWFAYLIRNTHARIATWEWLTSHWNWVKDRYENDHHYDTFAHYAASSFTSHEHMAWFKKFFEPKRSELSLKRTIDIGLSEMDGRIEWVEQNKAAVFEKLSSL